MFNFKKKILITSLLIYLSNTAYAADEVTTQGGIELSKSEIEKWSITIYPDGRNLPAGSGNAFEGEKIYQTKCMMCHGLSGEGGVAPRLAGELGYQEYNPHPLLALTVGAWPHQTTIFDYIRRAMPHQSPKTLNDSEVYALTAYILNLNGIVKKDETIDKKNLLEVEMPYKKKSYIAWDTDEKGKLSGKEPLIKNQ
ncbi:c-type cytochrome [Pseudoalteromonas distincta]|uniref:c-type cytochrome n=1 Tax=Pseudoalteromonas distincta TaxID=77608 RepID=UPI0039ED5EED